MSRFWSKLLPASIMGKIAALFTYIASIVAVCLSITYFMGPSDSCISSDIDELTRISVVVGLLQLAVGIALVFLSKSLVRRTGAFYNVMVVMASVIVLVLQLLFATGFAFGIGTACSTY